MNEKRKEDRNRDTDTLTLEKGEARSWEMARNNVTIPFAKIIWQSFKWLGYPLLQEALPDPQAGSGTPPGCRIPRALS